VRHGMPEFPGGERMYVGTTDVPLSALGRIQGYLAGLELRNFGFEYVFSSPLSRAYDTAGMICPSPIIHKELREMYAGDWEGLSFRQVREQWPELYERRGTDQNIPIPNSESMEAAGERFAHAVDHILGSSHGDIVIVAHLSVLRAFICKYLGIPLSLCRSIQIPCGSYTVMETGETTLITSVGIVPSVPLSEEVCLSILDAAKVAENIRAHCVKVAEKAGEIADALIAAGCVLNKPLIIHSAILHDIARPEHNHAEVGGKWLSELGYSEESRIVSAHHSILPVEISEAAVVCLADRVISGTEEVGMEKRFALSMGKCTDTEAKNAHRAKYENTLALRELFNELCTTSII